MPTLIASYAVYSAAADTSTLTTPSFTPSNGEVIVVKLTTWDTAVPMGTVSGGGQTYTTRVTAAPGGFNGWARIVTAVISGSPGSMTVSAAGTASNTRHCMVVERWGSASLAGTPAVNSTVNGTGAPSANITTTAANSIVTWCSEDNSSQDPTTRTYRLSATEDGLGDFHVGANTVQYFAYATVGSASTVAMGMTAPASQTWVLAGVEVLNAAGSTVNADASLSATAAVTPTAAVTRPASGSVSATAAVSPTAAVARPAAAATTGSAAIASAAAVDRAAAAALTATAGLSASATASWAAAAALTATAGIAAAASAAQATSTALAVSAAVTAAASVVPPSGRFTPRPVSGVTVRPSTGVTLRP